MYEMACDLEYYPTQDSPEFRAIKNLRDRLDAEENALYPLFIFGIHQLISG